MNGAVFFALPGVLKQASIEWIDDGAPRLGAAVSFYTLLSLAPVVVIVVALVALVYGYDAAQGRLEMEIQGIAGAEVARTIQEIIKGASKPRTGAIATLLGVVTLMLGASSVFVELHEALNTIWHVSLPPDRTKTATVVRLIKDRFYAFATVLVTGFLLLVSLVMNVWMAALGISLPGAVTFPMSYLAVTLVFAALYKILPDIRLMWRDVALGAAVTALLFMLGKQASGAVLRPCQLRVDI